MLWKNTLWTNLLLYIIHVLIPYCCLFLSFVPKPIRTHIFPHAEKLTCSEMGRCCWTGWTGFPSVMYFTQCRFFILRCTEGLFFSMSAGHCLVLTENSLRRWKVHVWANSQPPPRLLLCLFLLVLLIYHCWDFQWVIMCIHWHQDIDTLYPVFLIILTYSLLYSLAITVNWSLHCCNIHYTTSDHVLWCPCFCFVFPCLHSMPPPLPIWTVTTLHLTITVNWPLHCCNIHHSTTSDHVLWRPCVFLSSFSCTWYMPMGFCTIAHFALCTFSLCKAVCST